MLLRLTVANHRSIFDEQELSLVATNLKSENEILSFPFGKLSVLPSALLYGPNASGKSNFILALKFLRHMILFSHSQGNPEGGVPRDPFALTHEGKEKPTLVEADFMLDDVRYQYGFKANDERFIEEWFFSYPHGRQVVLFERKEDEISFGASFKGPKKQLTDLMRKNSLFLSTATQNNHEELSKIRKYFRDIDFYTSISVGSATIDSEFKDSDIDERTIQFLSIVGTGVHSYRKVSKDIPDEDRTLIKEIKNVIKNHHPEAQIAFGDDDEEKKISVELGHKSKADEASYLKLRDESAGTKRLLIIMNKVFKVLDTGGILVVDELDASLHTLATQAVLALFNDADLNKKGAQLIATVHDTNLLGSEFLSRDQIWFVEKNEYGETELYSLAEIKSRKEENFELGYLQGRYGATISPPTPWMIKSFVKDDSDGPEV